jgi:hypothetical protein
MRGLRGDASYRDLWGAQRHLCSTISKGWIAGEKCRQRRALIVLCGPVIVLGRFPTVQNRAAIVLKSD